ncbi:MAG: phosphoribosylanthranilate isomerase [Defluviitaleaceae bacterium]|nr:phosphoribosylanthranilate isomerase [Defluviitaleaceae bacterium]
MVKVKICGLTRLADIDAVNAARPDFIGFVFAESRRRVSPTQAAELRAALAPGIIPVGVFADAPIDEIGCLVGRGIISAVQLHGDEDEKFIAALKRELAFITAFKRRPPGSVKIIKAVAIEKPGDAQAWNNSAADFLLLDKKGGGTGETFDWKLIGDLQKLFFLAGGLSPENVADAVRNVKPFAVDVSSGVETNGVKDPKKIHEFTAVFEEDTTWIKKDVSENTAGSTFPKH